MSVFRKGFSLFEVMIAMAICVAGVALILQMLGTSESLSQRAELHLKTQQHCRNLLNCFLAGIDEPDPTQREELRADPNFWYSVELSRHPALPLEVLVVEVWPKSPGEREFANGQARVPEPPRNEASRFRLVGLRLIGRNEKAREGLDDVISETDNSPEERHPRGSGTRKFR